MFREHIISLTLIMSTHVGWVDAAFVVVAFFEAAAGFDEPDGFFATAIKIGISLWSLDYGGWGKVLSGMKRRKGVGLLIAPPYLYKTPSRQSCDIAKHNQQSFYCDDF